MLDFHASLQFILSSPWALRAGGLLLGAACICLYLRRPRLMRVVTVIDGDTVMAVNQKGLRHKLRIKGIDSPELGQRMSFEGKEFVEQLMLGKWVSVKLYGRDKYKRHLARIQVGRIDLSKELVRRGLAFPLKGSGLRLAGLGARMRGKGVWSGFGQTKPWESHSRKSNVMRVLNSSKKWRKFRKGQMEQQHRRHK
jgi:endonuclease YncB( thermonuclease family)